MASKPSKWASTDDDQESAAALVQRKKEKEERRRLKEEKARNSTRQSNPPADAPDGDERPTKRQRTSPEAGESSSTVTAANGESSSAEEGANILQFPNRQFGPCGHVDQFELLNNIEEGSYGVVSRARRKTTGALVALKKLKMEHTSDGFPVTGLREIQTLRACRHANIVELQEVVMGDGGGGGLKE
jgi:cell division cycle 2-like protein